MEEVESNLEDKEVLKEAGIGLVCPSSGDEIITISCCRSFVLCRCLANSCKLTFSIKAHDCSKNECTEVKGTVTTSKAASTDPGLKVVDSNRDNNQLKNDKDHYRSVKLVNF